MLKTWLIRGAALLVFGSVAGAWGWGLASQGADADPRPVVKQEATEDQADRDADHRRSADHHKKAHRKHADRRAKHANDDTEVTDPGTHAEDSPSALPTSPGSPDPSDSDPTQPSHPHSSTPSPSPSNPPSSPPSSPGDPDDDCTDLGGAIDCLLDPVTHHP